MQSVTANGIFKKKSEENPQHDVIIEVPEGDANTSPEEFQVETDFNDDYIEDSGSDQAPEAPESLGLKGFFSRTDHNKDRFDALEAKYDLLLNKIDKISTIKDEKKVNKYSHCWIKSPDFEAPFEPKHSIEDINGMKYVEMQFPKVKFTGISTSYSPARLMWSQIELASRGGNIHRSHIAQGHSTVRRVAPSTTCSSAAVPVGSEAVSASDRHLLENPPRSAHPSYQPTTFRRTPFVRFCGAL